MTDDPHLSAAHRVLARHPLVDGHNDLPCLITDWKDAPGDVEAYDLRARTHGCTALERLEAGRAGAAIVAIVAPFETGAERSTRAARAQMDLAKRIFARYPDRFAEARTAADVERVFASGRI